MKTIITFSGHSQRFLDEGFTIKPLIQIGKKQIFELAINTVTSDTTNQSDFIFIVKHSDCINYNIDKIFLKKYPESKIVIIEDHREGPVISILKTQDIIPDAEEIVVCYCDLYINWNFNNFIDFCRTTNSDGVIASHNFWHPHRVYNNYFCYLSVNGIQVNQLKEKQYFTEKPEAEPASSGVYYFKTGKLLKKYFNQLVDNNIRVNNEFYVTLPFNLMIEDNLNVTHYDHKNYFCLGTPKDVQILQSFQTLNNEFNSKLTDTIEYFLKYNNID